MQKNLHGIFVLSKASLIYGYSFSWMLVFEYLRI